MFATAQRGRSFAQGAPPRLSRTVSLPPPIGGINAVDSLANMPPMDAVLLQNFFGGDSSVNVRFGHASHATGLSGAVESLIPWEGPASGKLFAADSANIYEVTAAGAVGAAAIGSLTNGRWQHAMMATSGGNFVLIANGADSVRHYDGSSWATPTITNVTSATLNDVAIHKRRAWFVEEDSTSAWYLPVDSVAGAAVEFNFGPLFSQGGHLQTIGSMTVDSGTGPDDLALFFSSKGEVAVYAGTDPAAGSTWAIVGVFSMPPPIGKRCLQKVGGDIVALTKGGAVSLMALLQGDESAIRRSVITNKINPLLIEDAANYGANFGWEVSTYPRREQFIVNVPSIENVSQKQYVMNTITGAWFPWDSLNANCWGLLGDNLYFGGNAGVVFKADTGFQDAGLAIIAEMVPAFNYLARPGQTKTAKMIRPLLESEGQPGYLMSLNVDFGLEAPFGSLTPASISLGSAWDADLWDAGEWAGGSEIRGEWQGASGVGYAFAPRLRVSTNGARTSIHGFNLIVEDGGLI